jgi:3-oxoacyl-[acyl-carrier protein] reductase
MNQLDLQKKVAVITGGAQGIGLSTAKRMIASGAQVAIWDRDVAQLDIALKELGTAAWGTSIDIADNDSVLKATAATHAHFGQIDILVNNAAVVGPNAPMWEYPINSFIDVMNIGVNGTFLVTRAVIPLMIAAGYGRVVNVASIAGKEGNPNASAYSAAKAAVISLTKSLGKELADKNIAVNCVTPAIAKTKLAMEQDPKHIAYILGKIPRGRMLELNEASAMICWLCTEENSFTTGAVFDLSGGRATY